LHKDLFPSESGINTISNVQVFDPIRFFTLVEKESITNFLAHDERTISQLFRL
tara:strand:- start:16871 stop:17029 length:159 start_codon:yes stop_codon:yes gene_type:complete